MSANENLSSVQFIPAGVLRAKYPTVDAGHRIRSGEGRHASSLTPEENDDTMDTKLTEALEDESWLTGSRIEPLYDNIQRVGIQTPVQIHETYMGSSPPGWAEGWLGNGGHRVATAADIDPMMPVPISRRYSSFRHTKKTDSVDFGGWYNTDVRNRHGAADFSE